MNWADLEDEAQSRRLIVLGAFHPTPADEMPGVETVVLLGPQEPAFWEDVQTSPEWTSPDPVDTWSRRVIGGWANELNARSYFPFGGPPWLPFLDWAKRTGRIHSSPVGMLVHDVTGLFVSFRGALGLGSRLEDPGVEGNPCRTCPDQPCLQACPVGALTGAAYLADTCKSHLRSAAGADCMTCGCRARRACPISQNWGRSAAQSAYHMRRFLGD